MPRLSCGMIARLTGVLEQVEAGSVLLGMVGGVAHEVLIPAYWIRGLEQLGRGATVTLHTLEYLESQNQGASFIPRLIGFASPLEREFFELLTSVKGLGNKRALRAMASEPATIARAIHDRDTRALQRLPEIGPKLAELIVHELKSKIGRFCMASASLPMSAASAERSPPETQVEPKSAKKPRLHPTDSGTAPTAPSLNPPIRQTVETLITLGEAPTDAERLVARAIDRARAAGEQPPMKTAELVAAAYAAR